MRLFGARGAQTCRRTARLRHPCYITGAAKAKATALLDGSSIEVVASWADDYRRDHRETAPWRFINSPLTHYRIVLVRDCPRGQCVVAKGSDSL